MFRSFHRRALLAAGLFACLIQVAGCNRNPPAKTGDDGPKQDLAVSAGPRLDQLDRGISAIVCSPDGKLVAVTFGNPGSFGVWELGTKKPKMSPAPGYFRKFAFTSDSKTLVGINALEKIAVWDVDSGKEKHSVPLPEWKENKSVTLPQFMSISSDGKTAYCIHDDKRLIKLTLDVGKIEDLATDFKYFPLAAYSPELNLVVVAMGRGLGEAKELQLLMPGEKTPHKKVPLPNEAVALAFSKDGKTLAVSLRAKSSFKNEEENKKLIDRVEIWDTGAWKAKVALPKEPSAEFLCYQTMAISPDAKFLAGRADDTKVVDLWDIANQKLLQKIKLDDWASVLAFTNDAKTLLIGYQESGIQFVDTAASGSDKKGN